MLSPHLGVSEMLLVAAVALIVVGPKDLPLLMRRVGQFIARLRGMAAEFRNSFEDMARQTELDELRKEVEAMRTGQFTAPLEDTAAMIQDPAVDQVFSDIDAGLKTGEVSFAPHTAYKAQEALEEATPASPKAPRKPRAKAASSRVAKPKAAPAKASAAATPVARARAAKATTPKAAASKATTPKTAKPKAGPKPAMAKAATAKAASKRPARGAKAGTAT